MIWQRELIQNITTASETAKFLELNSDEEAYIREILQRYPMSVPRYYLSLINFKDENDPIRKMCIPSLMEMELGGYYDASEDAENLVLIGLQHKFRHTALILSTDACSMYCRHCFRRRVLNFSGGLGDKHFDEIIAYIRAHTEISNVLVSGGDAFMNSDEKIELYLKALTDIEHIDLVRFGTRAPVVFPQRITEDGELLRILNKYNKKKKVYVITQFNHPREVTSQSREAIRCLLDQGVLVKNQAVLLKGVNDQPDILAELLKQLTSMGVDPYYIFQCSLVTGVQNHFQVPIQEGYAIIEQAKAKQNGIGKSFRYCLSHTSGKIEILGSCDGEMLFKYHEAKRDADQGRIFKKTVASDQNWLYEQQL